MAKLHWLDESNLLFFCAGCKCAHYVRVKGPGPVWGWNQSMESPSFDADVVFGGHTANRRCHFQIENGVIEFFKDSNHNLAGQKAPLQHWVMFDKGSQTI